MIKTVKNDDIAEITKIIRDIPMLGSQGARNIKKRLESFFAGKEKGHHYIKYLKDSKIIGFAGYKREEYQKGVYDLMWIVVDKKYRGQGIGMELINHIEQKIKGKGRILIVNLINLRRNKKPPISASFYEKLGFRQAGVIPDYYNLGMDKAIYFKKIPLT